MTQNSSIGTDCIVFNHTAHKNFWQHQAEHSNVDLGDRTKFACDYAFHMLCNVEGSHESWDVAKCKYCPFGNFEGKGCFGGLNFEFGVASTYNGKDASNLARKIMDLPLRTDIEVLTK